MENSCKDLGEHNSNRHVTINKRRKKIIAQTKILSYMRKTFNDNDDNKYYLKVQDHCHYTAKYGGTAHTKNTEKN